MKVLVAGATGAIGTQLVPQLAAAGHDMIAMTRSPATTDALRALGPGRSWLTRSIPTRSPVPWPRPSPEVIVHQLTASRATRA